MSKQIRSGLWRCTSGYFARLDGQVVAVQLGAVIPRDLPYSVTDGRADAFEEVEVAEDPVGPFKVRGRVREAPVVEQATAAPGEVRVTGKRAKKKADD